MTAGMLMTLMGLMVRFPLEYTIVSPGSLTFEKEHIVWLMDKKAWVSLRSL